MACGAHRVHCAHPRGQHAQECRLPHVAGLTHWQPCDWGGALGTNSLAHAALDWACLLRGAYWQLLTRQPRLPCRTALAMLCLTALAHHPTSLKFEVLHANRSKKKHAEKRKQFFSNVRIQRKARGPGRSRFGK